MLSTPILYLQLFYKIRCTWKWMEFPIHNGGLTNDFIDQLFNVLFNYELGVTKVKCSLGGHSANIIGGFFWWFKGKHSCLELKGKCLWLELAAFLIQSTRMSQAHVWTQMLTVVEYWSVCYLRHEIATDLLTAFPQLWSASEPPTQTFCIPPGAYAGESAQRHLKSSPQFVSSFIRVRFYDCEKEG